MSFSPITQRRLSQFKANKRGFWSFWIFLTILILCLGAEFIANDKPLLLKFDGGFYAPIFQNYPETTFGGDFETEADYRDPYVSDLINEKGWMIWPPIRFSYDTINYSLPCPAPSQLPWLVQINWNNQGVLNSIKLFFYSIKKAIHTLYSSAIGAISGKKAAPYPQFEKIYFTSCEKAIVDTNNQNQENQNILGNYLGTDDQGRDVAARVIYGFRISVLFGLALTIISSIIGITAGAFQGYYGGRLDLIMQRLIEVWASLPSLYILIIFSAMFVPGFWTLLFILLLFSWVSLVDVVRAEFLRTRNFDYVKAANALGVSNLTIMRRHVLPNAMVATLTLMPFILTGSITSLTALDFLGLGLPPGSASLGELLAQGKNNLQAPWLGITAFMSLAIMLTLLTFIGEAVRDAFDPRKTNL